MPIKIADRRQSAALITQSFPGAQIIDVTSRGSQPWVRLSPFFPHGDIPVPLSPGHTGQSVEGIWQALKVFQTAGVDRSKLQVTSMSGIKRPSSRYGRVLGHLEGLQGEALLDYQTARRRIYLPAYRWALENKTADLVCHLHALAARGDVVLLDYSTNGDVADCSAPLSHAALIAAYLRGEWPDEQ